MLLPKIHKIYEKMSDVRISQDFIKLIAFFYLIIDLILVLKGADLKWSRETVVPYHCAPK